MIAPMENYHSNNPPLYNRPLATKAVNPAWPHTVVVVAIAVEREREEEKREREGVVVVVIIRTRERERERDGRWPMALAQL